MCSCKLKHNGAVHTELSGQYGWYGMNGYLQGLGGGFSDTGPLNPGLESNQGIDNSSWGDRTGSEAQGNFDGLLAYTAAGNEGLSYEEAMSEYGGIFSQGGYDHWAENGGYIDDNGDVQGEVGHWEYTPKKLLKTYKSDGFKGELYQKGGLSWVQTKVVAKKKANKAVQKGEAKVYIETDGVGHAYIEVKGTVFSYGRYDGSYSPSSGKFGPVGDGILIKENARDFVKDHMKKSPTAVYTIKNVNEKAIFNYFNTLYKNGTPSENGAGKHINTYLLLGNNCASTVCGGLLIGGANIDITVNSTPQQLNLYLFFNSFFNSDIEH